MNFSRKNLTETKLEILILEYLNNKPFLEELMKDTAQLISTRYERGVIVNSNRLSLLLDEIKTKWIYIPRFRTYKNDITKKLVEKFNKNLRNYFITSYYYVWY